MSLPETPESIRAHAEVMVDKILKKHAWMHRDKIEQRLQRTMQELSTIRNKRRQVVRLIDDINAAVVPYTPCRSGCSHCCKTAVVIYSSEAEAIASHTKIKAASVAPITPETLQGYKEGVIERYTSQPCPFLVNERCSIYAVRPFACRQQHSLNPSAQQCDTTKVKSSESLVTHMDFKRVEFARAFLANEEKETVADIREFFPTVVAGRHVPQE